MLLNLLRGYTVQAALDAPRFCISAGSPETESTRSGQSGDINSEVYFEEGIPDAVIDKLRRAYPLLEVTQMRETDVGRCRDGPRRAPGKRGGAEHVRPGADHPEARRQVG